MENKDVFDRIMALPGLRRFAGVYRRHREILLYVFFGGCTTLVSVGSFVLLDTVLGVHELLANVFSWLLAVGFAYVTNRTWVFASKARGRAQRMELFLFYAGRLLTLALEEGLLLVFVTCLGQNSTVVKLLAQVMVLISNYILSKLLIFRKK